MIWFLSTSYLSVLSCSRQFRKFVKTLELYDQRFRRNLRKRRKPTCRLCRMTLKTGSRESPADGQRQAVQGESYYIHSEIIDEGDLLPFLIKFRIILRSRWGRIWYRSKQRWVGYFYKVAMILHSRYW